MIRRSQHGSFSRTPLARKRKLVMNVNQVFLIAFPIYFIKQILNQQEGVSYENFIFVIYCFNLRDFHLFHFLYRTNPFQSIQFSCFRQWNDRHFRFMVLLQQYWCKNQKRLSGLSNLSKITTTKNTLLKKLMEFYILKMSILRIVIGQIKFSLKP